MSQYKLTYFDFSGSRGEECRMALCLAGPFEDVRIAGAQWADLKASTPFGSLPILEVEGRGVLAQTNAILSYLGRAHNLLPSDPWQAARHEALLEAVEDVRYALVPSGLIEDEAEKKAARLQFAKEYLKPWAARVEQQVAGPFVGGERISVADVKIFQIMNSFQSGTLDYVPVDVFAPFAKLSALHAAVAAHPKIAAWREAHAQ